jgi:hypothetical protein
MIRDSRYVVPDIVWTDPDGDRYTAHVIRRGCDAQGVYVVIEFEDDDGLRSVRVSPAQLEVLR